jgi:glutamine synthetase
MNETELLQKLSSSQNEKIQIAVTDIDGVFRGKIISKKKFLKGIKEGYGFCNVIFGWDNHDSVYSNSMVSGWYTGYPDAMATADLNTCRTIPWNNNTPFFIADFSDAKEIAEVCPRTLLKRIRQQCIEAGSTPQFAKEFEWFNFKETSDTLREKSFTNLHSLSPGMFGYSLLCPAQNQAFFDDVFNLLPLADVPLEGLHTETSNGVYEAAIDHTDNLTAADRAVVFKTSVKQIAYNHGSIACFMAKWSSDLPGCSGHIHQSLWDLAGN